MKRLGSALACVTVIVGASLAATAPSAARDWDDHRGGHGHHGDWDGRRGHGDWDRGHGHGHSNFSLFFDFAGPPPPPRAYYGRAPGGCQPFVQNGWWYGRPAQIGSTVCYDAWGNSYVVDGSAYVIQYLDGFP